MVINCQDAPPVRIVDAIGQPITLGQKTMAQSVPVTIASDQSPLPVNISVNEASSVTIDNLSVPLSNTEVSYAFPSKTAKFSIRSRSATKIQISFISGQSGTTYFTILPGVVWVEDNLDLTAVTLYLQTNNASQVIEIMSWQHG